VAIDRRKRLQRFSGRLPQSSLRRAALGGRSCCIGTRVGFGCLTMLVMGGKDRLLYQRFVDRHWQPLAMPHRIANCPVFVAKSS